MARHVVLKTNLFKRLDQLVHFVPLQSADWFDTDRYDPHTSGPVNYEICHETYVATCEFYLTKCPTWQRILSG